MKTTESFQYVTSDYKVDLLQAMLPQASAFLHLQLIRGVPRGDAKGYIATVKIGSTQRLDWRVEFHSRRVSEASASFPSVSTTPATFNQLLGFTQFLPSEATPYASSFLYYRQGLRIPYQDEDGLGEIHMNILNNTNQLDLATKAAGDSGAMYVTIGFIQQA